MLCPSVSVCHLSVIYVLWLNGVSYQKTEEANRKWSMGNQMVTTAWLLVALRTSGDRQTRRTSPSLICPTVWAGLKTNVMKSIVVNEAITFFAVDIKRTESICRHGKVGELR